MTVDGERHSRAQAAFQAGVTSSQQNLLVIAPPGCGKTELLAHRAAHLIDQLMPHQKILALTYSNRAKANLSSRLTHVLGIERRRRYVTIRNFHGHATEILRSHGGTLGLNTEFEQPDKNQLSTALSEYLKGLDDTAASKLTSRVADDLRTAKQRPCTDEQVIEWLQVHGHGISLQIEAARQVADIPFFDDLLRHAQRLMRIREIAALHQQHYGAVLVDEFQDLSPQQLDLALRTCVRSRTFVGDPLQGIYSWAGARPVHVERLLRRICGHPEGLGHSYRSSPKVLALLNVVATELGGPALDSIDPDAWHEGGAATAVRLSTGAQEGQYIVDTARMILERSPGTTIGVISRAGWRRKPVDAAFDATDLPTRRWDLAIDDDKVLELLQQVAAGLGRGFSAEMLLAGALDRVEPSDSDTRADLAEAVAQLAEISPKTGSVAATLDQLNDSRDPDSPIPPGVHLLNAHVGKGQQFDWVFVPGFEKGHIPSFLAMDDEMAEELRVLLVMISRARHGIVVTKADQLISKKGNPYATSPSRWEPTLIRGMSTKPDELAAHIAGLPTESA